MKLMDIVNNMYMEPVVENKHHQHTRNVRVIQQVICSCVSRVFVFVVFKSVGITVIENRYTRKRNYTSYIHDCTCTCTMKPHLHYIYM